MALSMKASISSFFLILLAAILPLAHTPALRYFCVVVIFLLGSKELRQVEWQRLGWVVYAAAAWSIFSFVSWFWSVAPDLTERHWFSDVLIPVLALAGGWSCREVAGKLFKPCLAVFTWALFLTAGGYLLGNKTLTYYYSGVGISSTLALAVIPFWLGMLWGSDTSWRWIAGWHMLMLLAVGLISGNRMFWVVLFAILLPFIFFYYSLNLKKVILLGLSALLIMLVPLYFIYIWRGGDGGFEGFGNMFSRDARLVIWSYWISLAWKAPWIGIGFGRGVLNYLYGGSVPSEFLAIDRNIIQHGHNIFLDVFVQLGIVGLLIYGALIVSLLSKIYKGFMNSGMDIFWAAPFLSLFAILLKNQTDDFMIFTTPVAVMFFLGMVLAYSDGFPSRTPVRLD